MITYCDPLLYILWLKVLGQGSTIALRSYDNGAEAWLACFGNDCGVFPYSCGGNVCPDGIFEIYHSTGTYNNIQVGEQVGLYSLSQGGWLSLTGNYGHTESCPGEPNLDTGFHRADSWFYCGSEVFILNAIGKFGGDIITENDLIQLYFPLTETYVSVDNSNFNPVLTTCPSSVELYDCPIATFEVVAV